MCCLVYWFSKQAITARARGNKKLASGDERKKVSNSVRRAAESALTFINIDRNHVMQSQQKPAEQKRTDRGKIKGKIKAMDTLCDFLPDRSCFQWASSKGTNHQKATGNWQEYTRTQNRLFSSLPPPHFPFASQHLYFLLPQFALSALYFPSSLFFTFSNPVPLLILAPLEKQIPPIWSSWLRCAISQLVV